MGKLTKKQKLAAEKIEAGRIVKTCRSTHRNAFPF